MRDHPISRHEKLSKKAIFFTGGKNIFRTYFMKDPLEEKKIIKLKTENDKADEKKKNLTDKNESSNYKNISAFDILYKNS